MYFEGGQLFPSKHKKGTTESQASTSNHGQDVKYEQQTNSYLYTNNGTLSETNNVDSRDEGT